MGAKRIYLQFEPRLYSDLIEQLFKDIGQEVILSPSDGVADPERVIFNGLECSEIMVFSLENLGMPPDDQYPYLRPNAKILAISPNGEYGYRRMPGEKSWEEIRPFGIAELLYEVLSEGNQVRQNS